MESKHLNKNEVKKDLYKSKEIAKFTYYDGDLGKMYYTLVIFGVPHLFGINVFDIRELVDDLKGAKFASEMKGSDLNRWIMKAIDADDIMKLA